MSFIGPGSTIGVLGSGQLGRMFALAARQLGYRVQTYSPDYDTPTGQVADREIQAAYEDLDRLRAFAQEVDVITFEFENVPAASVAALADVRPVRPGPQVLQIAQHRVREKSWLRDAGFPVTPFAPVHSATEFAAALEQMGSAGILKTAGYGYDGKGQQRLESGADVQAAWDALGMTEGILEALVPFTHEVSVIAARGLDGSLAVYDPLHNRHAQHILDLTSAPAPLPDNVAREARDIARGVLEQLAIIGVLCVEFFVVEGERLLINELAPRPHNSGHLTIDACACSQFEQQLRAITGLPLGDPTLVKPAAMANLLGDLWAQGEPDWGAALSDPGVRLHLYGKAEPRAGRKMGHLTVVGSDVTEAEARVLAARERLHVRNQ